MKIKIIMLLFSAAFLFTGFNSYQDKDHPGKKVFIDSKCQTCHSIETEGITAKTKKKDIPDLSGVGSKYQANFLEKFLVKKEKIEGASHPQAFKGSDENLEYLVEWLNSLKVDTEKGTDTKEMKKDTSGTKK